MNVLILHPDFPGQFMHLACELVDQGHRVVGMSRAITAPKTVRGITVMPITGVREVTEGVHRWAAGFEVQAIRARAAYDTALQIRKGGFTPDIILAHPGWGDSMMLKEVWPTARMGIYCEYFTDRITAENSGGAEFMPSVEDLNCLQRIETANWLLHFEVADAGISPTHFQAGLFPAHFRDRIRVIFDGIDTTDTLPSPDAQITLNESLTYTRADEVITYVSRNFEPSRGYHTFMRSLPDILRRRPNARILIVGGAGGGYGFTLSDGDEWRKLFLREIIDLVPAEDWSRVHFLGAVPHAQLTTILQLSRVHIYLSAPIMLSWSMMEAMAAGCTIVGSRTAPVMEMISHDENGRLVEFDDPQGLSDEVCDLLDDPDARARLGAAARAHVVEHYDLHTRCLPAQMEWVESLL